VIQLQLFQLTARYRVGLAVACSTTATALPAAGTTATGAPPISSTSTRAKVAESKNGSNYPFQNDIAQRRSALGGCRVACFNARMIERTRKLRLLEDKIVAVAFLFPKPLAILRLMDRGIKPRNWNDLIFADKLPLVSKVV
jgi:hypothetical protein